jgi:hypothetical protein
MKNISSFFERAPTHYTHHVYLGGYPVRLYVDGSKVYCSAADVRLITRSELTPRRVDNLPKQLFLLTDVLEALEEAGVIDDSIASTVNGKSPRGMTLTEYFSKHKQLPKLELSEFKKIPESDYFHTQMVDLAKKDAVFGKRVDSDSTTEDTGDESEQMPKRRSRRHSRILPEEIVEVHGHRIGSVSDGGETFYRGHHVGNILGRQIPRPAGTYRVINGKIYVTKERLDELFSDNKSLKRRSRPRRKVDMPKVKTERKRPRDEDVVDLTQDEPSAKKRVTENDDHYTELFKHLDAEQKRIMWVRLSKELFKDE